jgi:hypothetical protein
MRPAMHHLSVSAVRADALFVSALQRSEEPSTGQVRQAVAATVRAFGGRGCAERVAQEFGDHPETAAARIRWARAVTGEAFGTGQPAAERWLRQQSRPGGGCGQAPAARRRAAKSLTGARQAEYV